MDRHAFDALHAEFGRFFLAACFGAKRHRTPSIKWLAKQCRLTEAEVEVLLVRLQERVEELAGDAT